MDSKITRRGLVEGGAGLIGSALLAESSRAEAGPSRPARNSSNIQEAGAPFVQKGGGAILRTQTEKIRESVSLSDFMVANPSQDATEALYKAIAALGAEGGTVEIPPGEWAMNAVITSDNVTLRGKGGAGEFMRACIRPFSLDKPALTFGGGDRNCHYCGLTDLHVSGADGKRGSEVRASSSAPQALLLRGGTVNFTAFNCVFYNGLQTVALIPSSTNPVTANKFIGCTIRNDLNDSPKARGIYNTRHDPDRGYSTSNKFIALKLNGPSNGYAAEFDGSRTGIAVEINDSYWDVAPGHGILIKGSTGIICFNLQVDPGTTGAVILETDQVNKDPTRYISGMMRHGGQKMKFGDGSTIAIPDESDNFSYKSRISSAFFSDLGYFSPASAPYSTKVYYDFATDLGPMRWHGIQHRFMDTTDASEDLTKAGLQAAGGLAVEKSIRSGSAIHARQGYFVSGVQVVGSRQGGVTSPRGGKSVDAEARRAIEEILSRLQAHGLIS